MALVSQREYAERRGVSHTAVQRAIREGRIKAYNGKINPEEADAQWDANTRNKILKRGVSKAKQLASEPPVPPPSPDQHRKRGRPRKISLPTQVTEDSDADPPPQPALFGKAPPKAPRNIQEETLWLEHFNREKLRLQVAQKKGELVPRAEVDSKWFKLARTVRDVLLAIPGQLSAELAADENMHSVHRKLEEAICRGLEELGHWSD